MLGLGDVPILDGVFDWTVCSGSADAVLLVAAVVRR